MCVPATQDASIDAPRTGDGDLSCKTRVVFVDGKPPFSPDDGTGQREIWAVNPDGSGAINLSNSTADDAHPTLSPDGLKVAFTSNRVTQDDRYQLFVVNVDGSGLAALAPTIQRVSAPVWSTDGTRIAFATGGNVWTMNADGSGPAQLAPQGVPVAWSPDGKKLLFDRDTGVNVPMHTLYVSDIAAGGQPLKLNTGNAQEIGDGWAPLSQIVTDNRLNVFVVNSDGTGLKNLTQYTDPISILGGSAVGLAKTNTVVYARSRDDNTNRYDIWSVPLSGGAPTHITTTEGLNLDVPSSTNGDLVAFIRGIEMVQGTNDIRTSQVGIIDPTGANLHLFNAPGGQDAGEAKISTSDCH